MYLAQKTGKFWPKDGPDHWRTMEWLMWQMGGVGPMLGQVHHFVKYNQGKAPYAEERYLAEAHRLYGVLDRRLAEAEYLAGSYSIADMATWPWISRFEWQTIDMNKYAERPALVQGDRGAAGGAEGLSRTRQAARHPDAGLRLTSNAQRGFHMEKQGGFSGVIAPVLTPFGEDGNPDAGRFVDHAHWLMEDGCTGLAPFGTTSEANSLGLDERMELLEELVDDGIEAAKLMPGTGTCSLADTIMLTRHAMDLGCGGVLMLPPFYYKGPSEEGLFRFFAEAIEGVGDDKLKVYLYHIPPVAQVGFSLPLIGRLHQGIPRARSSVSRIPPATGATRRRSWRPIRSFEVFPGSEIFLLDGLRKGGAGCISATCNVSASAIRNVYDNWKSADADKLQAGITALRKAIQAYPMIPALKALIAHYRRRCRLGQGARAVHRAARRGGREGDPHAGRRARLQARLRQGRVTQRAPSSRAFRPHG